MCLFLIIAFISCRQRNSSINISQTQVVTDSSDNDILNKSSKQQINDCCWQTIPEFIGGQDALYKFLSDNLVYPDSSKKAGIEGKVIVNFVIDTTGKATDIKISNGLSCEIDKEVIRVFKIMPKWKPGTCTGIKKIPLSMNIPIEFKLE
jgi:TonB family protein